MEIKRTGSEDFPDRLKMLIAGHPKTGKTTFVGGVPNIIVADTEAHANNLQSIAHKNVPYVTINSSQDLRDLHIQLYGEAQRAKVAESLGMPAIEAVAIDTLDTLQQILKTERMKEKRQTQFLRDDWGWLKEEMVGIVRAFTNLPLHVIFTVHIKTQALGDNNDGRTIVLPGLQGAIAEEIAGMVGYSLYSFRTQEVGPDGAPFTKYWVRTEGDETLSFIGNRAAGRLPDIMEPSFQAIYEAAIVGRRALKSEPAPVQIAAPQPEATPTDDSDLPVNAAALSHIKKVYDALGADFPEDPVRALTMGQARDLVRMWKACQADEAEGKIPSAAQEMNTYLDAHGLLLPEGRLDITAPIEAVLEWVGDDAARAQEAWDQESKRPKARSSLLTALVGRGAADPNPPAPDPEPEVTNPEPEPEPEPDPIEEATEVAVEALGATVLDQDDSKPCEVCGKAVDDVDIAVLGRSRFGKWLCVNDYITATKA